MVTAEHTKLHAHTPAGSCKCRESHTHSSVCHFLISCCSVLKPLHPPCREQTLCSFLFVMVITLSLTVLHFACQLAFILFGFFSFLSSACTVRFLGEHLSPSLHHSPLLEPIILSSLPFQFLQWEGQKEIQIYSLCYQHHTFTNLFLRSCSRDFHSLLCLLYPSQSLLSVASHSYHEASPDSVNKGFVVCDTNVLLCDTLSGVVGYCSRISASESN